jgi:hypothetical protein
MNSIKPIDRKSVTRLFVTIILILGAVNSNAQNEKSIDRDTFLIDNIPFSVEMPKGWWLEQINNGLCSDSTYNYVGVYRGATIQQNASIVIQITELQPQPYSNKKIKKKDQPEFNTLTFAEVHALQLDYPPRKKKKCKGCGFEFLDVTATPLSNNRVLNIYFTGNGTVEWMYDREEEYKKICKEFILANNYALTCMSFPLGAEMNMNYLITSFNRISFKSVFSNDWIPTFDTSSQTLVLRPTLKSNYEQHIEITAHYVNKNERDSLNKLISLKKDVTKGVPFTPPPLKSTKSEVIKIEPPKLEGPRPTQPVVFDNNDPDQGSRETIILRESRPNSWNTKDPIAHWADVQFNYRQLCYDSLTKQNFILSVKLKTRVYDPIYLEYYEYWIEAYTKALAQWNHGLILPNAPQERKSFLIFDTSKFTYTTIKNAASGIKNSQIQKKSGE